MSFNWLHVLFYANKSIIINLISLAFNIQVAWETIDGLKKRMITFFAWTNFAILPI
jgi:hypothetical protein